MKTCLQIILVKKKITLESSGEESDDSSLLESVTKEVEQLKPYLYEPLCSTHSKSCNNEGSNIEVDVVAGGAVQSRSFKLVCMCKNCKEESRDGCTLASFSTGQLFSCEGKIGKTQPDIRSMSHLFMSHLP